MMTIHLKNHFHWASVWMCSYSRLGITVIILHVLFYLQMSNNWIGILILSGIMALHMEKLRFREPNWIALKSPRSKWQSLKSDPSMPNATVHVTDHELASSPSVFISCILFFKLVQERGLYGMSKMESKSFLRLCSREFPCILRGRTHQCHWLRKSFLAYLSALTISQEDRVMPEREQRRQWMNNWYLLILIYIM